MNLRLMPTTMLELYIVQTLFKLRASWHEMFFSGREKASI
jgi:hypothetical protein